MVSQPSGITSYRFTKRTELVPKIKAEGDQGETFEIHLGSLHAHRHILPTYATPQKHTKHHITQTQERKGGKKERERKTEKQRKEKKETGR